MTWVLGECGSSPRFFAARCSTTKVLSIDVSIVERRMFGEHRRGTFRFGSRVGSGTILRLQEKSKKPAATGCKRLSLRLSMVTLLSAQSGASRRSEHWALRMLEELR